MLNIKANGKNLITFKDDGSIEINKMLDSIDEKNKEQIEILKHILESDEDGLNSISKIKD